MFHFAYRKIQQKWEAFPFVKASPGAGIARFVTDCCISFEIINKCLFLSLPPGGKVSVIADE